MIKHSQINHIKTLARSILLFLMMTLSILVNANNSNTTAEQVNSTNQTLSEQRLKELITTLESETGRQTFIDNLKTLMQADQREEEEPPFLSVSEILNLDQKTNSFAQGYVDLLNTFGLTDSGVGNFLTLVIAMIIIIIFMIANKKLANALSKKLSYLRKKLHLSKNRFELYFSFQIWFGYIFGIALGLYAGIEIFNLWPSGLRRTIDFSGIIQDIFTFLLIAFLFISLWEFINGLLEYGMYKNSSLSDSRTQTILPIVRRLILVILLVMASLITLSELGIDIVPLLAGAGVLGIAIGFGAQTLVKDFLTGFTIILEDLLQIDDVVGIADRVGYVEKITMRKIQIRSLEGTVHTIPFSEVSIIDNLTKEFSYYMMDVGVAYREDTDEVVECLQEIDEEMRNDKEFGEHILEPIDILGVDQFADSAVIIKARVKTKPHEKWLVGREYNRRMKIAFDKKGIEIPFPHQTIYFGEDKKGHSPAANIQIHEDKENSGNEEN